MAKELALDFNVNTKHIDIDIDTILLCFLSLDLNFTNQLIVHCICF